MAASPAPRAPKAGIMDACPSIGRWEGKPGRVGRPAEARAQGFCQAGTFYRLLALISMH